MWVVAGPSARTGPLPSPNSHVYERTLPSASELPEALKTTTLWPDTIGDTGLYTNDATGGMFGSSSHEARAATEATRNARAGRRRRLTARALRTDRGHLSGRLEPPLL